MSKLWTKWEDNYLSHWLKEGRKNNHNPIKVIQRISKRLGRGPRDCVRRWRMLQIRNDNVVHTIFRNTNKDYESLTSRIESLENKLDQLHDQLEKMSKENVKLKEDMRFFEAMLLEEYHLLIQLLDQDRDKIRIHQV